MERVVQDEESVKSRGNLLRSSFAIIPCMETIGGMKDYQLISLNEIFETEAVIFELEVTSSFLIQISDHVEVAT